MSDDVGVADLHVHTALSDGDLDPEELVADCLASRLEIVAITDHDTTEGVQPSIRAARGTTLTVIPGIEISSRHRDMEIHILGFFVTTDFPELLDRMEELKVMRVRRIFSIAAKLKSVSVDVDPEEILSIAGNGTVGRRHVATLLEAKGVTHTASEAFWKYIGERGPAYVSKETPDAAETIGLIHRAGGVAALAHPGQMPNDTLVRELTALGLDALEAYYPSYGSSVVEHYETLAATLGLAVTGGSDAHGPLTGHAPLGQIRISRSLVAELEARKPDHVP